MADNAPYPPQGPIDHAAIDRAIALATRDTLLEHARMGRSVHVSRDGKIVEVTPAEIFAHYGLDENGKPNPPQKPAVPPDPLLAAQLADWMWLDGLRGEGKLDAYRGEFVIAGGRQIFGHGRDLINVRPAAENAARATGLSPERLIDYFMPGE